MDKEDAPQAKRTQNDTREATLELHGQNLNDEFHATGKILLCREQPSAKSSGQALKETLELLTKILLGLAGFSYVLGVLVVSVHLRQYGLSSLTLSQLNYVTAGVWTLVPICLILLFIVWVVYATVLGREEKSNKFLNIIGGIGSAIILFSFVVGYFSGHLGVQLGWVDWLFIPLLGTLAAVMVAAAVFMLSQTDTYKTTGSMALGLGLAVVALLLSLGYVVLFATHTYGDIPAATGGGSPSRVELVVTSDSKLVLESVGIKFSGGQNRTDSLRLLQTSEKEYVIINADGRAVSVPADAVKSVIYEK
jgi:hypothetical protein